MKTRCFSQVGLTVWLALAVGGSAVCEDDPDTLETAGDGEWSLAIPHYHAAVEAWERAASHATKLRDVDALSRSRIERAGLAALLRDTRLLDILRGETGSPVKTGAVTAPQRLVRENAPLASASAPSASISAAADLNLDASLEKLVRFLQAAERRYARLPQHEERDLVLLAESSALVHRVSGDLHQVRADAAFARALLAGAGRDAPETTLRAARLRFKLGDFAGAEAALAGLRARASALSRDATLKMLVLLRDLKLFDGDAAGVALCREELRKLSGKEEEVARPGARFESLVAGSAVDLAETAQAMIGLIARCRLPPRELALASLIAGESAIQLGEYSLAEEVLRGPRVITDAWLRASILGRLGMAGAQLGDYEPAVHALEEAKAVAAELAGAEVFAARVALNLSRTLLGLGDIDRARQEALEVLKEKGLPPDLRVRARILIGSALYETARDAPASVADAEAAFQAAKRDLESATGKGAQQGVVEGAAELEAVIAINLGNVSRLRALGLQGEEAAARRKDSIALQDKALRAANAAQLWPLAAVAAANLGELYVEAGDLAAAKGFVEWAMARAVEHRIFETEWRCHWYRGRIADAERESSAADSEYAAAAIILESYRSRILDAEKKSGFLTDKMAFYRDLVRRELRRNRPDLALGAAERAKARSLIDSLGWRFIALSDPRDTALYREYVSLLSRAEKLREGTRTLLLGVDSKTVDYEDLHSRLAALKERLTKDRESGAALHALIDGDPSDAAAILRQLPERSTLVEYFSLGDVLIALVGSGGRVEAVTLPVSSRDLDSLVSAYVRGGAGDAGLARRLYSLLIAPLEDRIRSERLVLVPFGSLYEMPFETLRDDRGYLVSRWDVLYLPSASVLKHLRRARATESPPRLLAVVDPDTDYNHDGKPDMPSLPHAREEVDGFASSFASRSVLVGPAALKLACQRDAATFDVIHYACHGEFYPTRPWESTLFLAPGVADGIRDDGKLRASEVYALDLRRSRLVALSGCETGRSQVSPGDDAVGIGTAFLHSGASSLLVSLWKVEDLATAALMKAFYQRWIRDGKDKGRALRESKLELIAGRFSHPRQWGAFVLIGEP